MMANSFGKICEGWEEKNSDYKVDWEYNVGEEEFLLRMHSKGDLTMTDEPYVDISTKAALPDSTSLSEFAVTVSLNVLKAQLELFRAYGIRI